MTIVICGQCFYKSHFEFLLCSIEHILSLSIHQMSSTLGAGGYHGDNVCNVQQSALPWCVMVLSIQYDIIKISHWSWKNKTSKYNINLSFHIYFCFIYVCVLKKHNQRVSKWTMLTYIYIRFQNIWYHDLTWTYRLTNFVIGYDRAFFMVHVQI